MNPSVGSKQNPISLWSIDREQDPCVFLFNDQQLPHAHTLIYHHPGSPVHHSDPYHILLQFGCRMGKTRGSNVSQRQGLDREDKLPGSSLSEGPSSRTRLLGGNDGTVDRVLRRGQRPKFNGAIFIHAGAGFHSHQNERVHLEACNKYVNPLSIAEIDVLTRVKCGQHGYEVPTIRVVSN